MIQTSRQDTKEFKEGAVRLLTQLGRSIADAAKSLGIPSWSLSRRLQAAKREAMDGFRGQGQRTPLEQRVAELRQQVKQLEEERAILKRAVAYFAKHLA
jgi:transposase